MDKITSYEHKGKVLSHNDEKDLIEIQYCLIAVLLWPNTTRDVNGKNDEAKYLTVDRFISSHCRYCNVAKPKCKQ